MKKSVFLSILMLFFAHISYSFNSIDCTHMIQSYQLLQSCDPSSDDYRVVLYECCESLMEAVSHDNGQALLLAVEMQAPELVEYVLSLGGSCMRSKFSLALQRAKSLGNQEIVDMLNVAIYQQVGVVLGAPGVVGLLLLGAAIGDMLFNEDSYQGALKDAINNQRYIQLRLLLMFGKRPQKDSFYRGIVDKALAKRDMKAISILQQYRDVMPKMSTEQRAKMRNMCVSEEQLQILGSLITSDKGAVERELKFVTAFRRDGLQLLGFAKEVPSSPTTDLLYKYQDDNWQKFLNDCDLVKVPMSHSAPLVGCFGDMDNIIRAVAQVEKSMKDKGYVTFVHGRDWRWRFVNQCNDLINAAVARRSDICDKVALKDRGSSVSSTVLHSYRKDLMSNGTGKNVISVANETGKCAEVTFMNRTLLSNLRFDCTALYFLKNHSCAGKSKALEVVKERLRKEGLSSYAGDFEELFKLHKAASQHGEVVTISIPKDKVDDMVYVGQQGGYKQGKKASKLVEEDERKTCERKNGFIDNCQPCRNVTSNVQSTGDYYIGAALDIPGEKNGAVFQSIHDANPEKLKKYEDARKQLFARMRKSSI